MLKAIRLGFQGPLNPKFEKLTDATTLVDKFPYILLFWSVVTTDQDCGVVL